MDFFPTHSTHIFILCCLLLSWTWPLIVLWWGFRHQVVSDSCDPMDSSPPVSSVYGIFQARILGGLPFPSPGDPPAPGIEPGSPALQAHSLHLSYEGSSLIVLVPKIQINISNCPTDLVTKIAYSASNWIKANISLPIYFLHSHRTSANFTTTYQVSSIRYTWSSIFPNCLHFMQTLIWRMIILSTHVITLPQMFPLVYRCCLGSHGGVVVKNPPVNGRRCRFDPWVGKMPWRRARQPSPVLPHGQSHAQRSLVVYSSWIT